MNRPYKNPNRWMINHVPVMQENTFFDNLFFAFCRVMAVVVVALFVWILTMV